MVVIVKAEMSQTSHALEVREVDVVVSTSEHPGPTLAHIMVQCFPCLGVLARQLLIAVAGKSATESWGHRPHSYITWREGTINTFCGFNR